MTRVLHLTALERNAAGQWVAAVSAYVPGAAEKRLALGPRRVIRVEEIALNEPNETEKAKADIRSAFDAWIASMPGGSTDPAYQPGELERRWLDALPVEVLPRA